MFEDFYLHVQLTSDTAKMPERGTDGSAGLDFFTPVDIVLQPYSDFVQQLDIKLEFPANYVLLIFNKSSIVMNKKVIVGAEVIDSDYRGIIHVHLINTSASAVKLKAKTKVCQGLLIPVWHGTPIQVNNISNFTSRGEGKFGSTGEY